MPNFDDDARLREMFAEFRGEVAPYVNPPGTAAARRWVSRRRRVTVAAIAAGAVLFVGGPAVGFAAANNDTPTPLPIGPTELPSPDPTTPAPTTPPPTQTSTAPSEPGLPKVTGKVFYTDRDGKIYQGGRRYPGGDSANVNVSPDGKRVTWVEDGDLVMSDLDGSDKRDVHLGVEQLCVEPIWSADGTRLLINPVTQGPSELGIIYLAGGAGDHIEAVDGCHVRWSANGKRIGYQHGDFRGVTVRDLSGGDAVTLDRDDVNGRFYAGFNGLSSNGDRVCVFLVSPDSTLGDVGRDLSCNTIIDVSTKKVIDLPFEGTLTNAIFLADGGMLARVEVDKGTELVLLDADDRIIARSTESDANAQRDLLAYVP